MAHNDRPSESFPRKDDTTHPGGLTRRDVLLGTTVLAGAVYAKSTAAAQTLPA